MSRSDATDDQVTEVASHAQSHFAVDMVAQQGTALQAGSNTQPRPMQPAPIVSAMAAASGAHELEAMAIYPMGASGAAINFDLSVSPAKDDIPDAKMTAGSSRRRVDHSHTPSDRNRSGSRAGSVKRAAEASGRPPRGRPGSPWEDDIRAVHRRVSIP